MFLNLQELAAINFNFHIHCITFSKLRVLVLLYVLCLDLIVVCASMSRCVNVRVGAYRECVVFALMSYVYIFRGLCISTLYSIVLLFMLYTSAIFLYYYNFYNA